MGSTLKRIDDGLARGEAAIAAFILLVMIFLAAAQALLYNLATRGEIEFAQQALLSLGWIDDFLKKGTLWLAFLGASLATHKDQHIAIDALSRVLPGRLRYVAKILVLVGSAVACYFLARVFFDAALGAQDRPLEYELLGDSGPIHICEGTSAQLTAANQGIDPSDPGYLARPGVFCSVRSFFAALGAPVETPTGALQLIVPAMFLFMGVRFAARSIVTVVGLARGDADGQRVDPHLAAARDEAKEEDEG
jgi:TRAP-type C4-dicarboxylate transport system permease small subunit